MKKRWRVHVKLNPLHYKPAPPPAPPLLPSDLASGGVNLKLDTLNGAALQVRSCIACLHEAWRHCP